MRFKSVPINTPTLSLIAFLVLTTAMSAAAAAEELLSRSPERGGIGLYLQQQQSDETFRNIGKPIRGGLLNKLDERLSLIVTDKASTSAISFSDVMGKLADDMGVDKLTLFHRWWETATETSDNLFCNSAQQISGFPYQCPRAEGDQADPRVNPFDCANPCHGYTAIAFVNRFDLADKDHGRHCGEFRIVFARNSGFGAAQNCHTGQRERVLAIFEALVPNPRPPLSPVKPRPDNIFVNLAGCRPIVEFWLSLSDPNMSSADRGTALRHFFLNGLPYADVGPVVDAKNYAGGPASGQIRTNQRMQGENVQEDWTLREFKAYDGRIVPVTVKTNPGNSLIWKDPQQGKDARELEFADYLVRKDTMENLRGGTAPTAERGIDNFAFGLTLPGVDQLNSFESNAQQRDGNVVAAFESCGLSNNCPIFEKLSAALVGSTLIPENIIHRIRTQTCAGCHHYSNGDTKLGVDCPEGWPDKLCDGQSGIWPSSLGVGGFTHVSEMEFEDGEDGNTFDLSTLKAVTPSELRKIRPKRLPHLSYRGPDGERYRISDTLKYLLMPPRFENMVLYLNQFDASP
jgi:hypothetical protein